MITCGCGYSSPTKKGMAAHKHHCDKISELVVHKCQCGYNTRWKSHLLNHLAVCKKQFYNPNINYTFEPHPETIDQTEKHQFNMVELMNKDNLEKMLEDMKLPKERYITQKLSSEIFNEQIITTKIINKWTQQEN